MMGQWISAPTNQQGRGENYSSVFYFASNRRLKLSDQEKLSLAVRRPSALQRATLGEARASNGMWITEVRVLREKINNGKRVVDDYVRRVGTATNLGRAKQMILDELARLGYVEPRSFKPVLDPPVEYTIDGVPVTYPEGGLRAAYGLSSYVLQQRMELNKPENLTPEKRAKKLKAALGENVEVKELYLLPKRDVPDSSPFDYVGPSANRTLSVKPLRRAWLEGELFWAGEKCYRLVQAEERGSTWVTVRNEPVAYRKGIDIYPIKQQDGFRTMTGTQLVATRPLERAYRAGELCWTGAGTFTLALNARIGDLTVLVTVGEDPALRSLTPEDRAAAEERLRERGQNAFTVQERDWWTSRVEGYERDGAFDKYVPGWTGDGFVTVAGEKEIQRARLALLALGPDIGRQVIRDILQAWDARTAAALGDLIGGRALPEQKTKRAKPEKREPVERWLGNHPDDV